MTWLSDHCVALKAEVTQRKALLPEGDLRRRLQDHPPALPFREALRTSHGPSVIAEIKFKSPSKGVLRAQRDVESVAHSYAAHGASALSVLVDETHFGGRLDFLTRARQATDLPLLAKGFLVDPYEVLEARLAGADAVLLIATCLSRAELEAMHGLAQDLGMAALVELHDEDDLEKVAGLPLDLVGVNHRNLHSLEMDLDLTRMLAPFLPAGAVKVAESGIRSPEDLSRMSALGYDAVLVGTQFMSQADPGAALGNLLAGTVP